MVKYYWIFGAIAGLVSSLLEYFLFSGMLGFERSSFVLLGKFLSLLVCIIFCVLLIKKLKGRISFLRTSFTGLMIALICSATSAIGYSTMHYPDGKFFEPAKDYHLATWKEHFADDPKELMKVDEVKQDIESKFSMKTHTFFDLTGYVVAGLLFSALLAAFVADRSSLNA